MSEFELPDSVRDELRAAWHRYIDLLVPFRPDLYRYCRRLTGNVWDAQDLVQDTLIKGFGTLGSVYHTIQNPRAYVLRIASNLWIDTVRRKGLETAVMTREASRAEVRQPALVTPDTSAAMHDAASTLLQRLSPQEQAAVVLKDVFDMSLEESAGIIGTTVGAVKAALHRGRARLRDEDAALTPSRPVPSRALVDRFVERYNEHDLPGLMALMLDSASIDLLSHVSESGREVFERDHGWFWHNFNVEPHWPKEFLPEKVEWKRAEFQGEPVVLVLNTYGGMEFLGSVMRLEELEGQVAKIRVYACCPEAMQEVGAALEMQTLPPMYRIPDAFEP